MEIDFQDRVEQEKKVAETYASIGAIMRQTWKIAHLPLFLNQFTTLVDRHFDWHMTAVLVRREDRLVLRAWCRDGRVCEDQAGIAMEDIALSADIVAAVVRSREPQTGADRLTTFPQLNGSGQPMHYAAYPLINRDVLIGVLLLGREKRGFDDCETDILRDLAEHAALAMDNISMYEQRRQYAIDEERNRLAKDLHDSVNQKLFTISLMAQGLAESHADPVLRAGLSDIGELAQESLSEMRTLIWDLHAADPHRDLPTKINDYAAKIGLHMRMETSLDEHAALGDRLEEALWRVTQEALNNVRKHAGVDHVLVKLHIDGQDVRLQIEDRGCGFVADSGAGSGTSRNPGSGTFGLTSMRERVSRIGGTIRIFSKPGRGTSIRVTVPIERNWRETGS